MKKYRVELSSEALRDFAKIHDDITDGLGEYWANLTVARIRSDINRLKILPLGCSRVSDDIDARKLKSGKYLIIFRIYERQSTVVVTHIFYARRDYLSILKSEQ